MLAERRGTQDVVAVKMVKKDEVVQNDDYECARVEKAVLAAANTSPFIAKLYSTFQTQVWQRSCRTTPDTSQQGNNLLSSLTAESPVLCHGVPQRRRPDVPYHQGGRFPRGAGKVTLSPEQAPPALGHADIHTHTGFTLLRSSVRSNISTLWVLCTGTCCAPFLPPVPSMWFSFRPAVRQRPEAGQHPAGQPGACEAGRFWHVQGGHGRGCTYQDVLRVCCVRS